MFKKYAIVTVVGAALCLTPASLQAQEAAEPAPPAASEIPEVEVIQKKAPATKKKAAAKKKSVAKKAPPPAPSPEPVAAPAPAPVEPVEATAPTDPATENSPYGSPASAGAQQRATESAQSPINPTQLTPSNLHGFSSAATNLTPEALAEDRPSNVNEALTRVPGVTLITDDSAAHHGGIGIRGSPPRRSRKILVMEDGHANNLALWLDPSMHYWGPIERFESIEVIRGTVITQGPNNNFGIVNARNLSPFGPAETVISGAIGFTKSRGGTYQTETEVECDDGNCRAVFGGDTKTKGSETDLSYRWHTHTRQNSGNVGLVASYTGANVQGLWDTETLRFNDFYGALGWKGSSSDVVVSAMYARQRDSYDEQNFLGEAEIEDIDNLDDAQVAAAKVAGFAESQFKLVGHCKTCFAPLAGLNNYAGEIFRGQAIYNAYLDDDTTITTRIYAQHHTRDRYQLNSYESAPDGSSGGGAPVFTDEDDDPETADLEETVVFGGDTMFGRLRTFRHIGAEMRGEWANRSFLGFKQDIQAGARYEYQDMTNRNFIGRDNEILKYGDSRGATIFDRELDANTVSAFLQTNIHVAKDFNVVPGVRFEWYEVGRRNRVVAREESEAGGGDDCEDFGFEDDECLSVDGIIRDPNPPTEKFDVFAPLPGVAFAYTGLKRTTVFGGYHRGLTTQVLRNEDFPGGEEIGDNFNLGLRSSAIKGFDFEVAGFYHLIQDYQYGASFSGVAGDRSFGVADEAEVSGVELYGRLNSQPYTGGSLNFFTSANYTYSRGIFKDLSITVEDEDSGEEVTTVFDGNRIPESPLHVAALTVGVEQRTGWRWDASVTWTYRGAFFTDEGNNRFGFEAECEEEGGVTECEIEEAGEDGQVPEIWLLSARFNMDIGNTGASVWVAGDNLLDKLYISDREDGMKPGLGRTIWTGFKYKF